MLVMCSGPHLTISSQPKKKGLSFTCDTQPSSRLHLGRDHSMEFQVHPGSSAEWLVNGQDRGHSIHEANCSPPGHYLAGATASKYCISSCLKMTGSLGPAEAGTGEIKFKR